MYGSSSSNTHYYGVIAITHPSVLYNGSGGDGSSMCALAPEQVVAMAERHNVFGAKAMNLQWSFTE